jgi:hypothetical protein
VKNEEVTRKLFTIAVGMIRSGKSLNEIQNFLGQFVAVSTKLSARKSAMLVNSVVEVFAKHVQSTGVLQADPLEDSVAEGQKKAETKTVGGITLTEVTSETHLLPKGAKVLTDEEYRDFKSGKGEPPASA